MHPAGYLPLVEWVATAGLSGAREPDPTCPDAVAVFTNGSGLTGPLRIALAGYGLAQVVVESMPLAN